MARSTSIWVVDYQGGPLVAAFTVKHELVSWLRRHRSDVMWSVYRVTRMSDGDHAVPTSLKVSELVGELRDFDKMWTPEQVQNVQEYQDRGAFHPYTCGGNGGPCSGVSMYADADGLHCPICKRTQTFAHNFILNGEWREIWSRTMNSLS